MDVSLTHTTYLNIEAPSRDLRDIKDVLLTPWWQISHHTFSGLVESRSCWVEAILVAPGYTIFVSMLWLINVSLRPSLIILHYLFDQALFDEGSCHGNALKQMFQL